MEKFLEKYNLPKLNQEAAESLNRPITAGDIKAVLKKTPSTRKPWTGLFHRRILQNISGRGDGEDGRGVNGTHSNVLPGPIWNYNSIVEKTSRTNN